MQQTNVHAVVYCSHDDVVLMVPASELVNHGATGLAEVGVKFGVATCIVRREQVKVEPVRLDGVA